MSAQQAIAPIIENVATDAAKQKKPTLPGKYSKLLNFGFWIASMADSEEMKAILLTQLRLYGSVEEQTELFERFFADEKETAKTIRKCIADHNKPPKPIKEKAAKAPRKGKAVVQQDELISQLIADATAAEPKPDKAAAKAAKEAERMAKEQEKAVKDALEKAAKDAEKLAKELAKEAEKAAKEQEKAAAKAAKEAEKLAKEQEKAAKATKASKGKKAAVVAAPVAPVEAPAPEPVVEAIANPDEIAAAEVPKDDAPQPLADELVAEIIEDIAPPAQVPEKNKATLETKETRDAKAAKAAKEAEKVAAKSAKEAEKLAKEQEKAAKSTKNDKKSKKAAAEPVKLAEEEEEIQTRIATIGEKDYLIDQEFNVYNMEEPHDHIGVYNQETGLIDAV